MIIDFIYQKDEFVDSRRRFLFMRKLITKLQVIICALVLVVDIILLCTKGAGYIFQGIYLAFNVIYIILIVIMCYLYFFQPGIGFESMKKFHETYHLKFLEDIIVFDTDTIHSELQWNTYSALWENHKYFYLLQTKDQYSLIPKRVFLNPEECKNFRTLFQRKLPTAEYKLFHN